mmetsp:Transcript_20813/g.67398  ORF Transcript_20813/g.67398 Transcript_20813/m.67398 type:complete len:205 (+) Transcript_20813:237-851(+)
MAASCGGALEGQLRASSYRVALHRGVVLEVKFTGGIVTSGARLRCHDGDRAALSGAAARTQPAVRVLHVVGAERSLARVAEGHENIDGPLAADLLPNLQAQVAGEPRHLGPRGERQSEVVVAHVWKAARPVEQQPQPVHLARDDLIAQRRVRGHGAVRLLLQLEVALLALLAAREVELHLPAGAGDVECRAAATAQQQRQHDSP